jgi:colanic acid/amylovoran biosynthesis glycosyltransferase
LKNKKIILINSLFPVLSETFLFDQFTRLLNLSNQFEIVANNVTPDEQIHPHMKAIRSKVNYLSTASIGKIIWAATSMFLRHPIRFLNCLFIKAPQCEEKFLTSVAHIVGACLIRKHYPDNAWSHAHFTYGAAAIAFWLCKLTSVPYSLTLHGADVNYDNPPDLAAKLSNASHLFSISKFNIDYVHNKFPQTANISASVLPLGVDHNLKERSFEAHIDGNLELTHAPSFDIKTEFKNKAKTETKKKTNTNLKTKSSTHLTLLNVGRLSEHKAQHLLIEACHQLKDKGLSFHCHIIGDGPKRASLEALIQSLGLNEQITLHGLMYHEDVLAFYQKADIFVMSSVTEGMPLVIMESMQRGVPVIAPSVSGIPEMIDNEVDGFLYQVGSVSALTAKIEQCFKSHTKLLEISQRAKKRVQTDFDLDANSQRFGDALINLAAL